jgi:hypothetical protein
MGGQPESDIAGSRAQLQRLSSTGISLGWILCVATEQEVERIANHRTDATELQMVEHGTSLLPYTWNDCSGDQ